MTVVYELKSNGVYVVHDEMEDDNVQMSALSGKRARETRGGREAGGS